MKAANIRSNPVPLREVAMVLLFDRDDRLLIYLRDDKPSIPFPNHWDLFGGHLEPGETPEQALVREVREELGIFLGEFHHFRDYECLEGDAYPNRKYVYWARVPCRPEELTLYEGQRLAGIDLAERGRVRFANILGRVVEDFVAAGVGPARKAR